AGSGRRTKRAARALRTVRDMRPILAAALVLLALPLSAQVLKTVDVDPPLPDSSMPVQLHLAGLNGDACVPSVADVRHNGKSIIVDIAPRTAPCILIPTPWGERVDVGRLAPGNYDVTVLAPSQSEAVVLGTA